jgi:hypothetical protein
VQEHRVQAHMGRAFPVPDGKHARGILSENERDGLAKLFLEMALERFRRMAEVESELTVIGNFVHGYFILYLVPEFYYTFPQGTSGERKQCAPT